MESKIDTFEFTVSFQTDIISYLLHDNGIFRKFSKSIEATYFTEYQFRDIMNIVLDFFEKYQEVPNKSTLLNEIHLLCKKMNGKSTPQDYQEYIDKIYTFDFNKDYVRDQVLQFIKIRAVYNGIKESSNYMGDGNRVLERIQKAVKIGSNIEFDGGYNYKKRIDDRLKYLEKGIRAGNQIPIGMHDIDHITSGGLGAGEFGVVIAPTGVGKTIFLLNVAKGACMYNKNVAYFTMESGEDTLAGRFDGLISKHTKEEMISKMDKLKSSVMRLPGELIIKEMPTATTTALDISNYIHDLINDGFDPGMIIVDYIGIMTSIKKFREPRHTIQGICQDLVGQVAKRFGVPLWSAHQSSYIDDRSNVYDSSKVNPNARKENSSKVIGIGDIAEAKVGLASECDLIVSMNQNSMERSMCPEGLRIYPMKNRIGPMGGIFNMTIDKRRFVIGEAAIMSMPTGR